MAKLLWSPPAETIERANMTRFIDYVNGKYRLTLENYWELYNWSVERIPDFWAALWDFVEIIASRGYEGVVDDLGRFPGARWFPGARLNFSENLLRYRDDHTAIIFKGETGRSERITYRELYGRVARVAASLREMGVGPGDRVAAYMPNIPETVIAMLAAASIGALWASCGSELGPGAVLDRLGQIRPRVLFVADGYMHKGRGYNLLPNIERVAKGLPGIEKVVVVSHLADRPDITGIPHATYLEDFVSSQRGSRLTFEQLPFDHPLYIMFSSGTTGKPKSMVQGAGGVLINHLKELILHTDLKRGDRITYITSPSWMMWNWLVSSLAVGATILLYDGNPLYPDWGTMWRLVQDEGITILGCSASYINHLRSVGAEPGRTYDLSSLREISQTGSPLSPEGFEWVYREVKEDLHFNSISGGTDINGCFAAGSPTLPVYAGQLQAPALAMKIKAYDEKGEPVVDRQGELVCEAPSPSMPLYFWDDPGNKRYWETYFAYYSFTGRSVWRHGDYVIFHSDTGGITFLGRSDATLKPSGVRIGTAEIYSVVERMPEVADSLAVGQNWKGDQRIILFVKLAPGYRLTEELREKIRRALREEASPRHVPALILEAPDIPYTFNMKKVEVAVANILNGRPVTNRDALVNPDSLDYFVQILPELQRE